MMLRLLWDKPAAEYQTEMAFASSRVEYLVHVGNRLTVSSLPLWGYGLVLGGSLGAEPDAGAGRS